MKSSALLTAALVLLLILPGCALFAAPAPTPTFPPTATLIPPTATGTSPMETQPAPSATPLPTENNEAFTPITAVINVDHFRLRVGPGFLFQTIDLYDQGTQVSVLGRARGDGWYYVTTPEYRSGWMKMENLDLQGDPNALPYHEVEAAQLIMGHVKSPSGSPASGIGVTLTPQDGDSSQSDTALTDESGAFYLYEPESLEGQFFIGPNSYNCSGSLIVRECELPYKWPLVQPVTLPRDETISIEFALLNL